MVEKIDVAFDACDANAEGAMMHGGPRLRERNKEGNAGQCRMVPVLKAGARHHLFALRGLTGSRRRRRNRAPFGR